jgi:predicted nucleic acid-binding protein
MILVDTSVWIDHLSKSDETMYTLLQQRRVLSHPLVIGEIAMGSFRRRDLILAELESLPLPIVARHEEVLRFISQHKLFGLGIGYIDAHLLAAVQLTLGATIWTRDKRLLQVANSFKLAFHEIQ